MLGTFVMLFTLLFGGPLVNLQHAGTIGNVFGHLSFMHYTFEALMDNELQGYTFDLCAKGQCIHEDADFMMGKDVLGLKAGQFWFDFALLGVFFAVLNVATYVLLKKWVKEVR